MRKLGNFLSKSSGHTARSQRLHHVHSDLRGHGVHDGLVVVDGGVETAHERGPDFHHLAQGELRVDHDDHGDGQCPESVPDDGSFVGDSEHDGEAGHGGHESQD